LAGGRRTRENVGSIEFRSFFFAISFLDVVPESCLSYLKSASDESEKKGRV